MSHQLGRHLMTLARSGSSFGTTVASLAPLSLLVIDGYPRNARQTLEQNGVTSAGELYQQLLQRQVPPHLPVKCDIVYPSDDNDLQVPDLSKYDGAAWTGCSLSIHQWQDDVRVARQIELARKLYGFGLPQFGSCWAAQIAVVAAGGVCARNTNGREMCFARKVVLSSEGRAHLMFEGKASVFDAFASHNDEIVKLPAGALKLADNQFCNVQAVAVSHLKGDFWAVQYHPEFNLHEMARLVFCRRHRLMDLGLFVGLRQVEQYVEELELLHHDPGRLDLAWRLGIDAQILEPGIREREAYNFVHHLVLPYRMHRLALRGV